MMILYGFALTSVSSLRAQAGLQVLHHAAAANAARVAKLLINQGADLMSGDMRGNTPLHYAAAFNAAETIRVLSSLGGQAIEVNRKNLVSKVECITSDPGSIDTSSSSQKYHRSTLNIPRL